MERAALLDVDGTLLESNHAHACAWADSAREFGFNFAASDFDRLIGMGGDKILATLMPGLSKDEGIGKAMGDRRKEIFLTQYLPDLKPTRGARELLLALRRRRCDLIVATSASNEELDAILKQAQIADLIEDAASSSDAQQSKPAPDIVEAALERTKADRTRTFMLGDTPYDILAAHRAGVRIIALRCGGWREPELADAESVFDDPQDLLDHLGTHGFDAIEKLFQ